MAKKPDKNATSSSRSGDPAKRAAANEKKTQATRDRREELRLQREAQERKQRNARIAMAAAIVLLVATVVTVVVVWVINRPTKNTEKLPDDLRTYSAEGQLVPPHANEDQTGIVDPRVTNPNAKYQIVVYMNYQCSWCAISDTYLTSALGELAERGEISITYSAIPGAEGARAAACADVVGKYIEYHDTVLSTQLKEGMGYTEKQLRVDFAEAAGITGEDLTKFQACYDNKQTTDVVSRIESSATHIRATPTYEVNGEVWDWSVLVVNPDGSLSESYPTTDEVFEAISAVDG